MRDADAEPDAVSRKEIYAEEMRSGVKIHEVYLNLDAYRMAMERLYRLCWQMPLRRYVAAYLLGATALHFAEGPKRRKQLVSQASSIFLYKTVQCVHAY